VRTMASHSFIAVPSSPWNHFCRQYT
jgi:hypothetical protein